MPCEYLKRDAKVCGGLAYRDGKLCQKHIGAIPYVKCASCERVISTKHGRPKCTSCDRTTCAAQSRAKTKEQREARKAAGLKAADDAAEKAEVEVKEAKAVSPKDVPLPKEEPDPLERCESITFVVRMGGRNYAMFIAIRPDGEVETCGAEKIG